MTTPEPILALNDVSVQFGSQRVLESIRFSVRPGETLAIIGESGCGKTCLLKLIVGLLEPTRGEVYFDQKLIAKLHERERNEMRLRMGFLFQQAALFDSLTVGENVGFGLDVHEKIPRERIAQKIADQLAEVGLPPETALKMPAELSGGMRKRVGLARALALDPEVMLYDEPTTGLDPIMTDAINELIIQTRERRPVTSLIITHELRTVYRVAGRVLMLYPLAKLEGGPQLIYDGPPTGLRTSSDPRVRQFVAGQSLPG